MNKWIIYDNIGNEYIKLILFQESNTQKNMIYFGDNKENGRLFQIWFFNT